MERHDWHPDGPVTERCAACGVTRIGGHYHNLKRPDRFGVSRKWRRPGPIRGGSILCPGKKGA